ncbi:MAG: hypothetical protein GQ531_11735, partial [Sulfurovum sp.]|nr:hypothetical protein [Sulfurovum sp.]
MYYILNETNQIIAADESLLNLCGVAHINELTAKISQGDTLLDSIGNASSFSITKTTLSSTLGDLNLVKLEGEQAEVTLDERSAAVDETELFTLLDDTVEEVAPEESINEEPIEALSDDTPLDLGLDVIKEEAVEIADITININKLSQNIGISTDDYSGFLNEFIDNAIDLEADLQSSDKATRSTATSTLSSLASVLHLPMVGEIINNIANAENPDAMLKSFYEVLSRITTTSEEDTTAETPEENLELFETPEPEVQVATIASLRKAKQTNDNSFGTISLEGIKPKHFDFQLEEAANDLSLPVELIEEFVHDFIEQAHIETKKMLEAYEEGDLDAIQKIGHLLKGA